MKNHSGENELNITDENISKKVYYIILIFSFLWLLLIFLAPVLENMGGVFTDISSFLYMFFSPVCHQDDARSFHIFSEKVAVCSRCLWIYSGFTAGTVLYPLKYKLTNENSPSVIFIIAASALIALDVFLDGQEIIKNSFISRSVTGFIIGLTLPFYLIPGSVRFFSEVNLFLKNKSAGKA